MELFKNITFELRYSHNLSKARGDDITLFEVHIVLFYVIISAFVRNQKRVLNKIVKIIKSEVELRLFRYVLLNNLLHPIFDYIFPARTLEAVDSR